MDNELKEKIKEEAKKRNLTMVALIRKALIFFIKFAPEDGEEIIIKSPDGSEKKFIII